MVPELIQDGWHFHWNEQPPLRTASILPRMLIYSTVAKATHVSRAEIVMGWLTLKPSHQSRNTLVWVCLFWGPPKKKQLLINPQNKVVPPTKTKIQTSAHTHTNQRLYFASLSSLKPRGPHKKPGRTQGKPLDSVKCTARGDPTKLLVEMLRSNVLGVCAPFW